jgi:two-component system LytT family response regulator
MDAEAFKHGLESAVELRYADRPTAEHASSMSSVFLAQRSVWGSLMKYRCVLVEDDERSLARLKRLLAMFPDDVEIVGEASSGPRAVEVIRQAAPDLVFLDIDLPGFNGFEVLERLDRQPAVVFTTAFNQHALEAFRAFAVDYLLKPLEAEPLQRSLQKLRAMGFNHAQFSLALERLLESSGSRYLLRIACKQGDRTVLVKTGEVLYFQADNKYTAVHTVAAEYLIDTPLVELEGRLNPRDFIRIHRSTLINVAWLSEIRRGPDGKQQVVMKDAKATRLPVSRSFADNLKNL